MTISSVTIISSVINVILYKEGDITKMEVPMRCIWKHLPGLKKLVVLPVDTASMEDSDFPLSTDTLPTLIGDSGQDTIPFVGPDNDSGSGLSALKILILILIPISTPILIPMESMFIQII